MRKRRRSRPRPQPDRSLTLTPILLDCPECQHRTYADYKNYRTISTLDSVFATRDIRRCPIPMPPLLRVPARGRVPIALPYHEFGLDVMAWSVASAMPSTRIHRELTGRAERTVTNLLDRYDELRALATATPAARAPVAPAAPRHPGHRRTLHVGPRGPLDLARLPLRRDPPGPEPLVVHRPGPGGLITQVRPALPVPITGVISDGQEHPQGGGPGPARCGS